MKEEKINDSVSQKLSLLFILDIIIIPGFFYVCLNGLIWHIPDF